MVKYGLERNGVLVTHAVMSGPVGYKVYQYPVVDDLVFDTKEKAEEVANIMQDAEVVVYNPIGILSKAALPNFLNQGILIALVGGAKLGTKPSNNFI